MLKFINKVFFYLKIIFLLIAFSFALYIAFMKMDFTSSNMLTILPVFIPFFILLILFVFDLFLDWKDYNLYCNAVSTLSFITITIITLRTVFDKNIVASSSLINFGFYDMQEGIIKALLYLMIIGNIGLLIYQKRKKVKIHS